jgi:hypothetical protein
MVGAAGAQRAIFFKGVAFSRSARARLGKYKDLTWTHLMKLIISGGSRFWVMPLRPPVAAPLAAILGGAAPIS